MNKPIFLTKPLWKNNLSYITSYCFFFFFIVVLCTIVTSYINDKCCKNNVGLITAILIIGCICIPSIISRSICVIFDKSVDNNDGEELINMDDAYNNYNNNDYVEV